MTYREALFIAFSLLTGGLGLYLVFVFSRFLSKHLAKPIIGVWQWWAARRYPSPIQRVSNKLDSLDGYFTAELKGLSEHVARLGLIVTELNKKKQDALTSDQQFLKNSEDSNTITRIAKFQAKSTMEAGLNQALPELVKQEVNKQLEPLRLLIEKQIAEAKASQKKPRKSRKK